jgi:hypothetical protein
MMIFRGLKMNKAQINPYGLWEVGVEISHVQSMNQEGKYNKEQGKGWR